MSTAPKWNPTLPAESSREQRHVALVTPTPTNANAGMANHVVPTTTIDELRGKVEKGPAVPSCYNYNTRQLRAEHFNATF
ncbi:hypothetical protein E4U12_003511 [Claviceps purpurea]|nr:hypothetical protein E4U12_003511 [Claviceps purpurea]